MSECIKSSNRAKAQFAAILKRCEGAYAQNTLRGYASDLQVFGAWCEGAGRVALPASPETIATFVDAQIERVAPSTLKRRIAAIKFVHRYGDFEDPTKTSEVLLSVRRATRRKLRRPDQAEGLTIAILQKMLAHCPDTLTGLRDATLISLGYDTLCRSGELAAISVEDINFGRGEDWSVLIRRAKADQAGDGRIAWLSPRTGELLARWLDDSELETGPLFRALHRGRVSDTSLDPTSVRRIIKRVARLSGLDDHLADRLSGHSMRVGAAQDMMVAGFDTLAIMQAGGWKSSHVLLRYVENASTRDMHVRRWSALRSTLSV